MKCISQQKVELLSLMLLLSVYSASAQLDPWNAKLMLHNSATGNIDTVLVGCDQNGGWGFQDDLDLIDTTFQPFAIWAYDSLINFSNCFNLQKDIKNFDSGIVHFNLQLIDTNPQIWNAYDFIKIDTNDFKFDNGTNKITLVYIQVLDGGYVEFVDNYLALIYYGQDTVNYPPAFYSDSISLIMEPNPFNCLETSNQMRLRLVIGFNNYITTGIHFIPDKEIVNVYPNPCSEFLFIENFNSFEKVEIFDVSGNQVFGKLLKESAPVLQIQVNNFHDGVYVLKLFDNDNKQKSQIKPIIVNTH